MNAIEIKGLSKHYSGFELQALDLCLPQGCIMGLVGENGAGKSTTINLIMNTIARDSGTVRVLGTDNQTPAFRTVKEEIGVVLDEAYFPSVLTAKNLGTVMKNTYSNWDSDCYRSLLVRFHLPEDKKFKDFSRGMKMKLAIAVALSHAPRLLILDEATSGLDPMVRDEILGIFSDFTRDETHSVLLSSHITSDLEKICDYIAFLHNGRLVLCEEKDRLKEEYAIVRLSEHELSRLPEDAVISFRHNGYGMQALVRREMLPHSLHPEYTSLEEIILFLAKEGTIQ